MTSLITASGEEFDELSIFDKKKLFPHDFSEEKNHL